MRRLLGLAFLGVVGCADRAEVASQDADLVDDIASMTRRPDGLFDVRCRDGRREVVSSAQILANDVCNGGAPGPTTTLRVRYACDGASNLEMRVLAPDGTENVERVAFTFASDCRETAARLTRARAEVTRPTFIGVCDAETKLQRFAASPSAGLRRITETPFSFQSDCRSEADRTNEPVTAIAGEVARVDYTCRDATLEMRVIGGAAEEGRADIPFSFRSDCTDTARQLRPLRTDVRTTSVLAICDEDAKLHRFSITPSGRLNNLGVTPFSFQSDCRRAMAEANQ